MKLAVCVKWVPDPDYPLQSGPDGLRLEGGDLAYMAAPGDLVACEVAVGLKQALGGAITVLTAGGVDADRGLRTALALGGDAAVRVALDGEGMSGGARTARLLAAALSAEGKPDVVLCGVRSPDSGSGAMPAALAEYLHLPLVTGVVKLEVENGALALERRLDGGRRELLRVRPPVVLTIEPSLATPHYPPVAARLRADRARVRVYTAEELGVPNQEPVVHLDGLRPPRPMAARLVAPPPSFAARERLRFILAGGPSRGRTAARISGPAATVADELVRFLRANGVAVHTNGSRD